MDNKDEYDVILKKIEYLATTKNVGTPKSRGSDKKKKKLSMTSVQSRSALTAMGSCTMFQMVR